MLKKKRKPIKRMPTKSTKVPPDFKISAAILELSEPLRKKYHQDTTQTKSIIRMAVTAWNLSVLDDEDQEEFLSKFIDMLPPKMTAEDIAVIIQNIDKLIKRKKRLYPHVREYILEHKLLILGKDMTLVAKSVPIGKKKTENL